MSKPPQLDEETQSNENSKGDLRIKHVLIGVLDLYIAIKHGANLIL